VTIKKRVSQNTQRFFYTVNKYLLTYKYLLTNSFLTILPISNSFSNTFTAAYDQQLASYKIHTRMSEQM